MPSLPLDDIAGRLLRYDVAEYLRLRAACKDWRTCTADPREGGDLDSRFRPRRWIMLSNNAGGARRRFLNLVTGALAHVDLPEPRSATTWKPPPRASCSCATGTAMPFVLNPLTKTLTHLPPITVELESVYPSACPQRLIYAGISDETSPPTIVLFVRGKVCAILYAKLGDQRWAVMEDDAVSSLPFFHFPSYETLLDYITHLSVSTILGSIYLASFEGNILKFVLHPKPMLVPVAISQPFNKSPCRSTFYLVPVDDHTGMIMVRYYPNLDHLTVRERASMKSRKNRDVIKMDGHLRKCTWRLIQVFKVDLTGNRLVQVEDIGHRTLFVGSLASLSLCSKRCPSVPGNAVYFGVIRTKLSNIGMRYLGDKSIDPPIEFVLVDANPNSCCFKQPLPLARPCTLQEYLVCYPAAYCGLKD